MTRQRHAFQHTKGRPAFHPSAQPPLHNHTEKMEAQQKILKTTSMRRATVRSSTPLLSSDLKSLDRDLRSKTTFVANVLA